MADLRGVIFVGNGRSADGAAASDGGGVQLDATVDHLRGIGADDITVITADPDAVSAESGLQVQDWNPGEGQVCGLLRAIPRTEDVELLVAEHPLQPTGDFQASQGSNNCVLVVVEGAAAGRPVDLVELEYEERRRVTQFAVRSVNDDGSYRHSGLPFSPSARWIWPRLLASCGSLRLTVSTKRCPSHKPVCAHARPTTCCRTLQE